MTRIHKLLKKKKSGTELHKQNSHFSNCVTTTEMRESAQQFSKNENFPLHLQMEYIMKVKD